METTKSHILFYSNKADDLAFQEFLKNNHSVYFMPWMAEIEELCI